MALISTFRDDFEDNITAPPWVSYATGSATIAETGGQLRATLPSSTAGIHTAGYQTAAVYDLTGDGCYINIGTMVATGVAASATFQVILDSANLVSWYQVSNTINVQKVVAGVATGLYTAAWSSSTYKYLRIRESAGTIFFDSSTNGTSWTNRASIVGLPFAISTVAINIGASCGNVASPGSFRVDDFNLILPALSSTWHYTQVEWPLLYRFRTITLAASSGQGYIATSNDGSTWAYYSGPIGTPTGGYQALTLQSTQAAAQAMAVNLPSDGRWDLPSIVECRYIRLYHRSITGSSYTLREYYPRRLVQSDDMEAESIRAINIGAGAVTADKIFVLELAAITATMGALHMNGVIDITSTGGIYQGTGTFASPTTGLKLFNSSGIGKLSGYNTGVEQITFDTDGKLKAGGNKVVLDASGININAVIGGSGTAEHVQFVNGSTFVSELFGEYAGSGASAEKSIWLQTGATAFNALGTRIVAYHNPGQVTGSSIQLIAETSPAAITLEADTVFISANTTIGALGSGSLSVSAGINVGTGSGATAGDVVASGTGSAFGGTRDSNITLKAQGSNTTNSRYSIAGYNSAGTLEFYVRNDGVGFLNAVAWTYSSDASRKRNIRTLNKDIVDFMKLEPKMFDYIDGQSDRYGYIAQDVQKIIPEIVMDVGDGSLGMQTDALLPLFNHVLRRLIRLLVQKGVIGQGDLA